MIIYKSYSGNCKSFAESLDADAQNIKVAVPTSAFVLVIPTLGLGKASKVALAFLEKYNTLCKGVVISGEPRFKRWAWGAGKVISKAYPNIPIIHNITKMGTEEDKVFVLDKIAALSI